MKIIDCRYRPDTEAWLASFRTSPVYARYMRGSALADRPAKSLEQCVAELEALNIVRAVIEGRDIESSSATPSTNALAEADAAAFPDLFLCARCYDPWKGMTAYRAMKDALAAGRACAAVIEPGMARCPADDARYYPLYALCCDAGAPVIVTAGLAPRLAGVTLDEARPLRLDRVAADFPDLRLLMSHGGYPFVSEALGVALRHENLFLDLSGTTGRPLAEAYARAAAGDLADRFVFSSANPFTPAATALRQAQALGFSADIREGFFYGNALRLFKNALA